MTALDWRGARKFAESCVKFGVEVPEALTRGLHLADVARTAEQDTATASLLDMPNDEFLAQISDIAVQSHSGNGRGDGRGLQPGVTQVLNRLGDEIRTAVLPALDGITEQLQATFDERAEPFMVGARQYGFTFRTSSDDVVLRDEEGIVEAWRATRKGWFGIQPIVTFRLQMTALFGAAPTARDLRDARPFKFRSVSRGPEVIDNSVMFAAGDNWSTDGDYYTETGARGHLDWLRLAASDDGIRLNTPSEVLAKLKKRRAAQLAQIPRPVNP